LEDRCAPDLYVAFLIRRPSHNPPVFGDSFFLLNISLPLLRCCCFLHPIPGHEATGFYAPKRTADVSPGSLFSVSFSFSAVPPIAAFPSFLHETRPYEHPSDRSFFSLLPPTPFSVTIPWLIQILGEKLATGYPAPPHDVFFLPLEGFFLMSIFP